ncbi:ABC transporter substrate-binding protein [Comamonas sp. Tr-654]|uniref:Bug family tripartite tricarboxylate transporter substrate binding protein n=1 Tax=Comamonas sp. Tr-654 TaxID=2608341 RepID=UPI001421E654|nr:Bug family tripartite tricarboxylate transporter substrate binding protein [Comamonas sp. Tr-654]NIF84524.1 ABC transporter substrate-binding protein [Comamonas sp. Tr-654]
MQRRIFGKLAAGLGLSAGLLGSGALQAQETHALFPNKTPLRMVVGYPPGGATDRVARIVADRLQARLGSPVIVENKPGAGGRLSAQYVKNAPASQPAVLLANPAVMVVAPLVFPDSGYDPEKDFRPISEVNRYEFGLAVASAVPVKELPHLLAWLKANPQQANFGVPATGSLPHFFALMLGETAKVPVEVVGYKGSGPLLTDLMGGQIPIAVDTFDTQIAQHEAGKLRVLATSGERRSTMAPNIPTLKELGVNLVGTGWNTLFAPQSMAPATVQRLSQLVQEVMKEADTQHKFAASNLVPVVSSAQDTEKMLKAYRAQWAPVVQRSGFKP